MTDERRSPKLSGSTGRPWADSEFRALLEAAPDAMVIADERGIISLVNTQTERLFGYQRDELLGKPIEMLIPERFREAHIDDRKAYGDSPRLRPMGAGRDLFGLRKDGSEFPVEISLSPFRGEHGMLVFSAIRDITLQKAAQDKLRQAKEALESRIREHTADLWFLESMDKINQATQGTGDLERLMSDVLDAVLSIFSCDRAWLVYPCDPQSQVWRTVMERTRPEFPGALALGVNFPMDAKVAQVHRLVRAAKGAVRFGAGSENPMPDWIAERFTVQSQLCITVSPTFDRPYIFGLDQCTYARVWTSQEQKLFEEIAQRLTPSLTSLLVSRDLQESKAKLEEAQRIAHVGYWTRDLATDQVTWSDETYRMFGLQPQERPMDFAALQQLIHREDLDRVVAATEAVLRGEVQEGMEFRVIRPGGEVRIVRTRSAVKRDAKGQAYQVFGTIEDITDSWRAERALRRSEAYLAEAQSLTHTGSWAWDPRRNIMLHSSDEIFRIYGLEPLQGLPTFETLMQRVHPEDRDTVWKSTLEGARQKIESRLEYRIILPDGTLKYIQSVRRPVLNEAGDVVEIVGTSIDVTDRKRVEEAVRRTETELRDLIENVPAMVFMALPGPANAFVSRPWREYTGLSAEETAGLGWQSAIHSDDLGRHMERWQQCSTSGELYEDEARFRCAADGRYRWFLIRAVPLRDETGKIRKWYGVVTDIQDRKQAEEALRRSEAYLAESQRLTHTGSWAFKADGGLYWSEEVFRLWGFDPQQPLPDYETIGLRIHPEDRDRVLKDYSKARQAKTEYAHEFRIVMPGGTIRYIHASHHPVFSATGEFLEVVGTYVDITEQKHAEKEREQLRQLEADLAHMNRVSLMGELGISLAHELKQPITAAVTNAQACLRFLDRDKPDLAEVREASAAMVGCAKRAAEIIDRLRSLSRKVPTEQELVVINEVVREMEVLLRSEAMRYSVAIRLELMENLPAIRADRVQLQQLLLNLMLNGIEAMRDSPGQLTVASKQVDQSHLLVSVTDNGVGLPEGKADHIFEAFFTTKPQGTGMGLAICRSIVESHGGRIWATPNSGRGTTFCFSLPCQLPVHT